MIPLPGTGLLTFQTLAALEDVKKPCSPVDWTAFNCGKFGESVKPVTATAPSSGRTAMPLT